MTLFKTQSKINIDHSQEQIYSYWHGITYLFKNNTGCQTNLSPNSSILQTLGIHNVYITKKMCIRNVLTYRFSPTWQLSSDAWQPNILGQDHQPCVKPALHFTTHIRIYLQRINLTAFHTVLELNCISKIRPDEILARVTVYHVLVAADEYSERIKVQDIGHTATLRHRVMREMAGVTHKKDRVINHSTLWSHMVHQHIRAIHQQNNCNALQVL